MIKAAVKMWTYHFQYLKKFCSSVWQAELSQNSNLQLVTDGRALAAVQCVRPLYLLGVSQLVQPADHLLNHRQPRH